MTLNQLQLFIIFIINGIIIGIIFDIFRVIRKAFKHKDFVIYAQDILFWILAGFILMYSTFIFNDGEFRFFMFVGDDANPDNFRMKYLGHLRINRY